ncbi:hypothetical protein [Streptomyces sp. SLBN-118]|uniref:hypothetical protein n=1 Tax=Streptomyces sp. SLBN-118 TaxID=2768454 RepID=UPI001151B9E7|nr:hypothetical protein [Streptomyces sp. SLBN-118]
MERRSLGEGSKGQRCYDWTWFDVTLSGRQPADGFAHHLLVRRSTDSIIGNNKAASMRISCA